MEKFLYFCVGAADGDATDEEIVCLPASRLRVMEAETATTTALWFASSQEDNKDVDNTKVVLTHASAGHKVVMSAVADACNENTRRPKAMTTVADGVTGESLVSGMTCTLIQVVEAA